MLISEILNMNKLKSRVAVVTGADSGIGKAIAEAMGAEGAIVNITYHSGAADAEHLSRQLEEQGIQNSIWQLDVTREQQVSEVFDQIFERYGSIDILVNNAGVNGSDTPLAEMSTETFDQCIKTNLYGPFYCCRKYLQLRSPSSTFGKIINISSVHEHLASAGNVNYNASKAGLKGFCKSLALELAGRNIQVNNIAPGMILTAMNEAAMNDDQIRNKMEENIPMRRAGQTEDIKAAAVFLASADSNYITGTTVIIDGGLSIHLGQGA